MIPSPNTLLALVLTTVGALLSVACVRPDQERKDEPPTAPTASAEPTSSGEQPAGHRIGPSKPAGVVEVTGEALLERLQVRRAKATLVNVWASWCGPCKEEFPMLIALKGKLAQRGVDVVFVSVDEAETHAAALTFASEHGLTGDLLVAARPLGAFKRAINPEWPGMLPATFLFDAAAGLRHFWGGPVYENELMPVIDDFLAGKRVDGQTLPGLSPGLDFRGSAP